MKIEFGDKIRDNDPRMGDRVLTIVEVSPDRVIAVDRIGNYRGYLRKSIHTDGRPRRSGFTLLATSPPEVK